MACILSGHGWGAILGLVAWVVLSGSGAAEEAFAPHPHQLDLDLANFSSFVASTSAVRVRENQIAGTRLHLAQDLSIDTMQLPSVGLT